MSNTSMEVILKRAFTLIGNAQVKSINWKDQSLRTKIFSAIVILATAAAVLYYIVTGYIAPLMLVLAAMIPLLCIGLNESSRSLTNLQKEFTEYNSAVYELIQVLYKNANDPNLTEIMMNAIKKVQEEGGDVAEVFDSLEWQSNQIISSFSEALASTVADDVLPQIQDEIQERLKNLRQDEKGEDAEEEDIHIYV